MIHGNVVYFLSPLLTFILLFTNGSIKFQWFADTFLIRAPITISAGCCLILSIRQATRSLPEQYSSMSTWGVSSAAVPGLSIGQGA
ncbi:hypothetical protein SCLCIDRAFT_1211172 [Scleroderma citrinum Foug A]|uniref:Uncharacterized protein n=1 Tax=Scleroderma citrinum Foug A TaxID=1036808 RepID=A0A0C3EDL4_9AGAM|nr:hypothetical protein SCLCIDRAFT_1211172 [Scleroderma citrinum Foug A]